MTIGDKHKFLSAIRISEKAYFWGGHISLRTRNLNNTVMNILIVDDNEIIARPDGMSIEEAWEIHNQVIDQIKC